MRFHLDLSHDDARALLDVLHQIDGHDTVDQVHDQVLDQLPTLPDIGVTVRPYMVGRPQPATRSYHLVVDHVTNGKGEKLVLLDNGKVYAFPEHSFDVE